MYILSKDIGNLEFEEYKKRVSDYQSYLASIKDKISLSPHGFIFEDWYRNCDSHRCPHDSWLDRIVVSEDDNNEVNIELKLLGAYHDGYIFFRYSGVKYYKLDRHSTSVIKSSHGDLRYEEFRLDDEGYLVHEFDWYTLDENAIFLIACESVSYSWEPIEDGDKPSRESEWSA